jgi:hypothetical protein
MFLRLPAALSLLANPALFPCQYFIIELDVSECAAQCSTAAPSPEPPACCCDCTAGACQPAESAAPCAPADPDDAGCRCCIRIAADPRLPAKPAPRPLKVRSPAPFFAFIPAPVIQAVGDSACARPMAVERNRPTSQDVLCRWLN